jgi:hypothetical protein
MMWQSKSFKVVFCVRYKKTLSMSWEYVEIKKKHRAHPSTRTSSHSWTHLLTMPDGGSGNSNGSGKDTTTAKRAVGMLAAVVTVVVAAELAAVAATTTAVTTAATMAAIVMPAETVTATAVSRDINSGNSDGRGHRQQWPGVQTTIN